MGHNSNKTVYIVAIIALIIYGIIEIKTREKDDWLLVCSEGFFGETEACEVSESISQIKFEVIWEGCNVKYRSDVYFKSAVVGISGADKVDVARIDIEKASEELWEKGSKNVTFPHDKKFTHYYVRYDANLLSTDIKIFVK